MYIPKEFKPLITPTYQPAKRNGWNIFMHKPASNEPRKVLAFYRESVELPKEYGVLMCHDTIWMSLTPMETESQGYHGRLATGNVVVAGLGMGVLPYHLLRHNSKVKKVTVIEKNPEVIDILKEATDWLVPSERLEIVVGDAREYIPKESVDTLLIDIWPNMGSIETESDVRTIQKNVNAKVVGWWGQELNLLSFLHKSARVLPLTREKLAEHEKHLGFPVLGYNQPSYGKLALTAAFYVAAVMRQRHQ